MFHYMDTHTSRRDGALPVSPGLAEEESYLPELETPPDIVPVDHIFDLVDTKAAIALEDEGAG